jgi:hypothetical protein
VYPVQEGRRPSAARLLHRCALNARLEVVSGFGRLEAYLASWAAFGEWLRARHRET